MNHKTNKNIRGHIEFVKSISIFFTIAILLLSSLCNSEANIRLIVAESSADSHESLPLGEAYRRAEITYKNSLFSNGVYLTYANSNELKSSLLDQIKKGSPADINIVVGISSTDDAIYLSELCKNKDIDKSHFLVISPLISGSPTAFPDLPILPACLPDSARISHLEEQRPELWKTLNAASIVTGDTFGGQLTALLKSHTNLYRSLDDHSATNFDEVNRFAKECFERRVPLIFVALNVTFVDKLLSQIRSNIRIYKPYHPIICFLQEYDFGSSNTNNNVISDSYRDSFSIAIASLGTTNAGFNKVVDKLDDDLFYALNFFYDETKGTTHFTNRLKQFFVQEKSTEKMPDTLKFTNSQYFNSLMTDQSPLIVKGLPPGSVSELNASKYNFLLIKTVLQARIAWLGSLTFIIVTFGLLIFGLYTEIRKRYIYVTPSFFCLGWRAIAWITIMFGFFTFLILLCFMGIIPSDNPVILFSFCLAPLSIIPLIQHSPFAKIQPLSSFVENGSRGTDKLMDFCVNTGEHDALKIYLAQINQDIDDEKSRIANINAQLSAAGIEGVGPLDIENYLLSRWYDALGKINDRSRSHKIYRRFSHNIKVWTWGQYWPNRLENLKTAFAYTALVLNSQS